MLDGGDTPTIEPIGGREALAELLRQSYALRFIGEAGVTAGHFLECAALARNVPVRRLRRPKGLALLPRIVSLIESDVHARAA